MARERPPSRPARPPRSPSSLDSIVLASGAVFVSSPAARAMSPPGRGAQTGSTLGLAPAIVLATRWPRRVRDRSGANSLLNCANNERPPSQPHSPVNHAVHAGGCRRHDRLGHRRRTDRSPVAGASARVTEMMRGSRRSLASCREASASRRCIQPGLFILSSVVFCRRGCDEGVNSRKI